METEIEQLCEICGKPEPSKYECPKDSTFICSRCVQNMVGSGEDCE